MNSGSWASCNNPGLLLWRFALGWYADRRLMAPRFHLRRNLFRASAVFFCAPEFKK